MNSAKPRYRPKVGSFPNAGIDPSVKTDSIEGTDLLLALPRSGMYAATLPPSRTELTGRNHPRVPNVVSRSR